MTSSCEHRPNNVGAEDLVHNDPGRQEAMAPLRVTCAGHELVDYLGREDPVRTPIEMW
jgi:hypothetical protein